MPPSFDADFVVREIQAVVPNLFAVYAFGSLARGDGNAETDLGWQSFGDVTLGQRAL